MFNEIESEMEQPLNVIQAPERPADGDDIDLEAEKDDIAEATQLVEEYHAARANPVLQMEIRKKVGANKKMRTFAIKHKALLEKYPNIDLAKAFPAEDQKEMAKE